MPNYEYYCKECQITQEINCRVRDRDNEVRCICGNITERQISSSNFHLKGVGWAKDGYRITQNQKDKRKRS
jgi:putative FmdB family regulatory protein